MPEHPCSCESGRQPAASSCRGQMQIGHTIAGQIIGLAADGESSARSSAASRMDEPVEGEMQDRRKLSAAHFCLPCPGRGQLLYPGLQSGSRLEGERPLHKCPRLVMHLRVPWIV
jgi:hypothetical protein